MFYSRSIENTRGTLLKPFFSGQYKQVEISTDNSNPEPTSLNVLFSIGFSIHYCSTFNLIHDYCLVTIQMYASTYIEQKREHMEKKTHFFRWCFSSPFHFVKEKTHNNTPFRRCMWTKVIWDFVHFFSGMLFAWQKIASVFLYCHWNIIDKKHPNTLVHI